MCKLAANFLGAIRLLVPTAQHRRHYAGVEKMDARIIRVSETYKKWMITPRTSASNAGSPM
jgi:hypothetical protein